MCRRARLELPPVATAPGDARRFVTETCRGWGLGRLAPDVALPVSELVTNAVLHACTPLAVQLDVVDDSLEVAVRDQDPRPPVVRPLRQDLLTDVDTLTLRLPNLDDQEDPRDPRLHVGASGSIAAGRGMIVVDALADEWGVVALASGKDVWFRIGLPASWPHRASCRCSASGDTTASGRPVRHDDTRVPTRDGAPFG
jgi:hypothetical protein